MKPLNLIALLAFLAIAVAMLMLNKTRSRELQDKVMTVFSPFIHASASVDKEVQHNSSAFTGDPVQVQRDNEKLQIEVQRLRIVTKRYDELMEENSKLRQQLDYKQGSPFNLTAARVVKRSAGTWWNTLIIDKGSLDGLGTDSPVITDVGLVGKTGKLSPHMAEVILLTDELCRVSAYIEGTREKGILAGERGGTDLRPDLRLRFLSRNAAVNVGANVYSSGDGGVFPPGLHLGKVKRFENREISGEAVVEPVVDFESLDHVFVIEMQKAEPAPAAEAIQKAEPVNGGSGGKGKGKGRK
ncbi:MAG: rod shape-determining protein MreC [Verrucomicrobiaceae bacterium]|nr:rod shape-determining protein MreC [Verrucomicrobiaceae bacterium]